MNRRFSITGLYITISALTEHYDGRQSHNKAMDRIFINDLKIDTVVGIYDWERRIRQTIILDIEMGADIRKAAASDDIEDALNYKAVCKRLVAFVRASEYQLVETLLEECARLIMEEFSVPWVRIKLNKAGALRGAHDVGIIIERGRA